ncbi:MAG: hypothetical protein JRD71_08680, partial [Deltaproteobacteria bacterium]|nr:hypothetical protein [Deltaproteobacteria bacterium]
MKKYQDIKELLEKIYGEEKGGLAFTKLNLLMEKFPTSQKRKNEYFSQEDVILITYGDTLNK